MIFETKEHSQLAKYPFTDDARMLTIDNRELPNFIFEDAAIYAPGSSGIHYISSIQMGFVDATITVSASGGPIGSATLTDFNATEVVIVDANDRDIGTLVGNFALLRSVVEPNETWDFAATGLPFAAAAVHTQPQSYISGFVADGLAADDVYFVGKDGIVLSVDTGTITIHAVGDRLSVRRENSAGFGVPLKRLVVNGVNVDPDNYGNITIMGGVGQDPENVLRIEQQPGELTFKALGSFE